MAFNRCLTYSPAVMAGYAAGRSAVTQVWIGCDISNETHQMKQYLVD